MRTGNGCPAGDPDCLCSGIVVWCAWCGEARRGSVQTVIWWCSKECRDAHKAANPTSKLFAGWQPMNETLPGGSLDGVWENSGFRMEFNND